MERLQIPSIVLANKTDLKKEVASNRGQNLARALNSVFAEVSAKTGEGTKEVFVLILIFIKSFSGLCRVHWQANEATGGRRSERNFEDETVQTDNLTKVLCTKKGVNYFARNIVVKYKHIQLCRSHENRFRCNFPLSDYFLDEQIYPKRSKFRPL